MLRNGLTLELVYDRGLTGRDQVDVAVNTNDPADPATPSCGVWLMGETVLTEVVAGQA
jgi:hypothetical protein